MINRLEKQLISKDLANREDIVFAATGVTTSSLLKVVEVVINTTITHSVLMRESSETIQFEEATTSNAKLHIRFTSKERGIQRTIPSRSRSTFEKIGPCQVEILLRTMAERRFYRENLRFGTRELFGETIQPDDAENG